MYLLKVAAFLAGLWITFVLCMMISIDNLLCDRLFRPMAEIFLGLRRWDLIR